jgi:hypothetical protein
VYQRSRYASGGVIKFTDYVEQKGLVHICTDLPTLKAFSNSLDETIDKVLIATLKKLDDVDLKKLEIDLLNPKYAADIKELITANPEDLINIWKRLKDNPSACWDLKDQGGPWDRWVNREIFKDLTQKGKLFETAIEQGLKDATPALMSKLKSFIPDLEERTILKQVYLCINNKSPCNNAGEYFIADFAFVKQVKDDFGTVIGWDVVIGDAKLSKTTSLTDNQKVASGLSEYILKSTARDLDGNPFNDIIPGKTISRYKDQVTNQVVNFLKIFSDGNGNFSDIIEIK